MFPLLAQLTESTSKLPDPAAPSSVGWILLGLAALAVALNQVGDFIGRFRKAEPSETTLAGQPLEVKPVTEYVHRRDHEAVVADLEKLTTDVAFWKESVRQEIAAGFTRLEDKRSASVLHLHERVERAVKELRTEVNNTLTAYQARTDKTLEAVSALAGKLEEISERLNSGHA